MHWRHILAAFIFCLAGFWFEPEARGAIFSCCVSVLILPGRFCCIRSSRGATSAFRPWSPEFAAAEARPVPLGPAAVVQTLLYLCKYNNISIY